MSRLPELRQNETTRSPSSWNSQDRVTVMRPTHRERIQDLQRPRTATQLITEQGVRKLQNAGVRTNRQKRLEDTALVIAPTQPALRNLRIRGSSGKVGLSSRK